MTKKNLPTKPSTRTFTKEKPRLPADAPAILELADAAAIQALNRGDASPDQQKRALFWIINGASRTYETSYRADSERNTCFAEGRRFVGNQVVGAVHADLQAFKVK